MDSGYGILDKVDLEYSIIMESSVGPMPMVLGSNMNDALFMVSGSISYEVMKKGKSQSKYWQCFSENYP